MNKYRMSQMLNFIRIAYATIATPDKYTINSRH